MLGLHALGAIRRKEKHADIHHVYAPQLWRLAILPLLTKPVVYSATAGIGPKIPPTVYLRRFAAIVVPSRRDVDTLAARGLENVHLTRSGIDLSRFANSPPPTGPEFVLLSGSAPWVQQQFHTKGVDTLLEAAGRIPELRLVFLWRGVLHSELVARVERLGLSERVEIVNERVDVSSIMRRVHAAVVLADRPGLVKAYPHSLLEALASGRPVIVSDGVPMAEYVRETECGRVVPGVDVPEVTDALRQLKTGYESYRSRAAELTARDFSEEQLVAAYQTIYRGHLDI